VKPDDPETFHDQVGYWLWEPATGAILLTLAIPRGRWRAPVGQSTSEPVIHPRGRAWLAHQRPSLQNPFSRAGVSHGRYTIKVDIHPDGTWSYEQDTLLVHSRPSPRPFSHTDRGG
jgi:hypothetical protein